MSTTTTAKKATPKTTKANATKKAEKALAQLVNPTVNPVELPKDITLTSQEITSINKDVIKSEKALIGALVREHKSIIDHRISVGNAYMKFRATVDNPVTLDILGGFTSFKKYMDGRKFGPMQVGYSQLTKYATIATYPDTSRKLFNEGFTALSTLATEVNRIEGKGKNTDSSSKSGKAKAKVSEKSAYDKERARFTKYLKGLKANQITLLVSIAVETMTIEQANNIADLCDQRLIALDAAETVTAK